MDAESLGQAVLFTLYATTALVAAGHALLHVRDPRSAWAWIALCWLAPLAGPLLYYLLGISRVQRAPHASVAGSFRQAPPREPDAMPDIPGVDPRELSELVRIGASVSGRPLVAGNRIEPLHTGEAAYAAMLEAIGQAQRTVWLTAYIFDSGDVGHRFADALAEAQARGVEVRVLLDGVGDLYYWPRGSQLLRGAGITVRRFHVPRRFAPLPHLNLRNHRKLLSIDGQTAFVGGMNIGDHHVFRRRQRSVIDLHFRVTGPIVDQLDRVFCADWHYASGEHLQPAGAGVPARGEGICRALTDGPDDDLARLQMVLLGVLANAHQRVCIMTPYFIPTPELASALEAAALRGVEIALIVPLHSNLPWVDWATMHWLQDLLRHGVRVYRRPQPFAHTKLLLMDHYYAQIGSANLDPRSLYLNFELVLEVYDAQFVSRLQRHFDEVHAQCHELRRGTLLRLPLWKRLRNAFCWLFSPYL